MSDTFNTIPGNWQGVDAEPVEGSRNLVESGGVAKRIIDIDRKVTKEVYQKNNVAAYTEVNYPYVIPIGVTIKNNGSINILASENNTLTDYHIIHAGETWVTDKEIGYLQTGGTAGNVDLAFTVSKWVDNDMLKEQSVSKSKLTTALQEQIDGLSKITENMEFVESTANKLDVDAINDGYVGVSGDIFDYSGYFYSDYIPVAEGDVVRVYSCNNSLQLIHARVITAYDENKNSVTEKGLNNTTCQTTFTIPSGISFIRVTIAKSQFGTKGMLTLNEVPTSYVDYQAEGYVATKNFVKKIIPSADAPSVKCFSQTVATLADGNSLSMPFINVNKCTLLSFVCNVTSFNKIEIGKRNESNQTGRWFEISSTQVLFHNGTSTFDYTSDIIPDISEYEITNNLQIIISRSNESNNSNPTLNNKASLIIVSNGKKWELVDAFDWPEGNNIRFVKSIGSSFIDCKLSLQAMDIDKPIWLFGDSYMSWIEERWVYYLAKYGYADNCLVNAFAGETTIEQIPVLDNLIFVGRPKYIVWCLGMNDGGDTDVNTPSSNWQTGINKVINTCNKYGITPIFATIPTVPTINNEGKNYWVRNSGYRYIDFAKAVGANSSGQWFSGMNADGVHPTVNGAIALFMEAITDFPELTATY